MTQVDSEPSMRLLRRSLLCLVVGVTAFGVAGWVLRPKPNWTVEIPAGSGVSLLRDDDDIGGDDWIWILRPAADLHTRAEVLAFDPNTGACMQTISVSPGFQRLDVGRRGRVIVVNERHSYDAAPFSATKISLYDARTGTLIHSKSFDGRADLCVDGRTAWCVKVIGNSLSLRVFDLGVELAIRGLEIADGFKGAHEFDVAVSPDGKLLAFLKPIGGDADDKPTIELWDIETKSRMRSIEPERRGDEILQVTNPEFTDDGGGVEYQVRVPGPHRGYLRDRLFDLKLGKHVEPPSHQQEEPPPPEDAAGNVDLTFQSFHAGWEFWTAFDFEEHAGWFGVFHSGAPMVPWRRVPFFIHVPPSVGFADTSDERMAEPPRRWLVHVLETPLNEALPENAQPLAPTALGLNESRSRLYWYNMDDDEWRAVGPGCQGDEYCLRADSVITLDETSKELTSLRRWRLPPRDLKLSARGFAVLGAGATWWWCARRYARKLRRDA
jgi:hypothetical protein